MATADMTPSELLRKFNIPSADVVCIYPYGSRIYGCHTESSDHDWVIVHKASLLPSGAFKDNAISSADGHQAICYSRGGFRSAIDEYDITALECIMLPKELTPLSLMNFDVRKWRVLDMSASLITKASSSWHSASRALEYGDEEKARKGVYHALRIITFGIQMADGGVISDYSACNDLRSGIMKDDDFNVRKYTDMRDELMQELRSKAS